MMTISEAFNRQVHEKLKELEFVFSLSSIRITYIFLHRTSNTQDLVIETSVFILSTEI